MKLLIFVERYYKLIGHKIALNWKIGFLLMTINFFQFLSINLDYSIWEEEPLFRKNLIFVLENLSSLTRLTLFEKWVQLELTTIFLFVFTLIFFITLSSCYVAYEFKTLIDDLIKKRMELEWRSHLGHQISSNLVNILRSFNLILLALEIPVIEVLYSPIKKAIHNEEIHFAYLILSFIGIFLFVCHIIGFTFFLNNFSFDKKNSFSRSVHLSDIWHTILNESPIIIFSFINMKKVYYLSVSVQMGISIICIYEFLNEHNYFDWRMVQLFGTLLFSKFFILLILLFGTILSDYANIDAFIVIMALFSIKLGANLTFKYLISLISDLNCSKIKSVQGINKIQAANIRKLMKKYLLLYSYFFYIDINVDTPTKYAKALPVEIVGFVVNHYKTCSDPECPLSQSNLPTKLKSKQNIFLNWEYRKVLKETIQNYLLSLFREINNSTVSNNADFCMNFMALLLTDKLHIFESIQISRKMHKISHMAGFYHNFYINNFIEIIMSGLGDYEAQKHAVFQALVDQTKAIEDLRFSTDFNSKRYIDVENMFVKFDKKISKYSKFYAKFLETLSSEKVQLEELFLLGDRLLRWRYKIQEYYNNAHLTPRFINRFLEFILIFSPDEGGLLKNLEHLLIQIKEMQNAPKNAVDPSSINDIKEDHLFFSSISCFIQVSGSLEDLGRIVKVDENSRKLFGYESVSAMQGQNVTFIMPKIISKYHDGYMRRFLKTGDSNFLFRKQEVFARRSNNAIFKVMLTVKPFYDSINSGLMFLTHLKPDIRLLKNSLILTDSFGLIDSFGGKLSKQLEKIKEENKTMFYIQTLIPSLEDFFKVEIENLIKKNPSYKKIVINENLNLRIYDSFPSFPYPLDIANFPGINPEKEIEQIMNYLAKIRSIMAASGCGCKIYRLEIREEDYNFPKLALKLFIVEKFTYAYYRTTSQIRRMDSFPNTLSVLPKMMKKAGILSLLRQKRRFSSEFPKTIKTYNSPMKLKIKTLNKQKSVQLKRNTIAFVDMAYSKSCDFNHELAEKEQEFFYSQCKGQKRGAEVKREVETPNTHNTIEQTISNSLPNNNSIQNKFKPNNIKFFAENKRFIFRIDTMHNRESTEDKRPYLKEKVKDQKMGSKKSSTRQRNQNEKVAKILKMIHEDYAPPHFKHFSYGHLIMILMVLVSFITAGTVVNQVFNSVSDSIDHNTEVERFKSNTLKYVMLSQFYKKFKASSDAKEIASLSAVMNSNFRNVINMEVKAVNELNLSLLFPKYKKNLTMSLIQGVELLVNYGREEELEESFILSNGLNILKEFNKRTNINELLKIVVDPIQIRILYVCFVSIGLFTFLLLFQFFNIYSVFKYLNSTLKLFLSLSTLEYEKLYENLQSELSLMNSQEITSKFDKPRVRKNLLLTKLEEGGTVNLENKIAAFKKLETEKGKKNKKTVRMIVRGVKFPFFQYFLLFFLMLLIFIGFFIFLLYESQMLDDSLYNSLSQNNYILSMKSDNFETFVKLIDKMEFSNSFGTEEGTIEQLINKIDGFPKYLLSMENDADSSYTGLLKKGLCNLNVDSELCFKIGEGVLMKGLNYAISFLLVKYKAIWLKIENLKLIDECIMIKTLNYAIENRIFELTQLKNNSIIDQLKFRNLLMLVVSLISAFILSLILIVVYTNYIGNALRKKVKNVRSMLKLIPVNSFLKSSKFKKYLSDTCHKTIMNL